MDEKTLVRVKVDRKKCDGEALCAELCPVNVFEMKSLDDGRKSVPVREKDCITCMICEVNCPAKAIIVEEE